jgi:hypothetical protein
LVRAETFSYRGPGSGYREQGQKNTFRKQFTLPEDSPEGLAFLVNLETIGGD